MAYVYILRGERGRLYVGSTADIEKRLAQHRSGHTQTTSRIGHFTLVLTQKYDTLHEARHIERRLKKMKRRDYLEKMIEDGVIHLKS